MYYICKGEILVEENNLLDAHYLANEFVTEDPCGSFTLYETWLSASNFLMVWQTLKKKQQNIYFSVNYFLPLTFQKQFLMLFQFKITKQMVHLPTIKMTTNCISVIIPYTCCQASRLTKFVIEENVISERLMES